MSPRTRNSTRSSTRSSKRQRVSASPSSSSARHLFEEDEAQELNFRDEDSKARFNSIINKRNIEIGKAEVAKGNCSDSMELSIPGELLALMEDDGDATESSKMSELIAREVYWSSGSPDRVGATPLVPFNDLNLQCCEDTVAYVDDVKGVGDEIRMDESPFGLGGTS